VVEIRVEDQAADPAAGVTVEGGWSDGANGSASCVTDAGGQCSVQKDNLKKQVSSVTFTVNSLSKTGWTYNSGENETADSISLSLAAPPPSGELTVSARPFKIKGIQQVELSWSNFSGASVEISRDGNPLADSPTANDGAHVDDIGAKGGGQTYLYQVCEEGTSNCASASAAF
jgi:hypothetical protein